MVVQTDLIQHSYDQGLRDYLESLRRSNEISEETANLACSAWAHLLASVPGLPVPDAAAGPNGDLLFTWDREQQHFELEIEQTGAAEFFYRNRITGALWAAEYDMDSPLSSEAMAKLNLFSAHYD